MKTNTPVPSQATSDTKSQAAPGVTTSPLVVRILRNPLFLVLLTWVMMAFLLAFDVSGK